MMLVLTLIHPLATVSTGKISKIRVLIIIISMFFFMVKFWNVFAIDLYVDFHVLIGFQEDRGGLKHVPTCIHNISKPQEHSGT